MGKSQSAVIIEKHVLALLEVGEVVDVRRVAHELAQQTLEPTEDEIAEIISDLVARHVGTAVGQKP